MKRTVLQLAATLAVSVCTSTLAFAETFVDAGFETGSLAGLISADVAYPAYPKNDLRHYLSEEEKHVLRPGFHLDFTADDITIANNGTVTVDFSIMDDAGVPLDITGLDTGGPVRVRWVFGYIPQDGDQYVSYINGTQTSPITGDSAVQPTSESDGLMEELAPGVYRYTFETRLPDNADRNAAHSIGTYSDRNMGEFDLGTFFDNDVVHFTPNSGNKVTAIPPPRELVTTAQCNNCHDPLGIHGGFRREVQLCIMCHTDEVLDPDTGNTVDMKIMIHKIHRGASLPSVIGGTPYEIIGFRQSVHDYSTVHFPMDIRNCESCHIGDAIPPYPPETVNKKGPNSLVYAEKPDFPSWTTNPGREQCGSCHDDLDFATGENHVGGPQISDEFCGGCHVPQGDFEFDASVIGAHVIPFNSTQLAGMNIEVLNVFGAVASGTPTVRFSFTDNDGGPLNPADFSLFAVVIAGPNDDYDFLARENAGSATPVAGKGVGVYDYKMETPLPGTANGESFTAAVEARHSVTLNAGLSTEFTTNESAENVPFYFGVGNVKGGVVPRRMVVADEQCEECHYNLNLHGSIRHNTQYCVTCHQPEASDVNRRPEAEMPPESIDFRRMIHRIHMGEELERELYVIYGFGGTPHDFAEVRFPGDRANCAKCHVDDSYQVNSPGILEVTATENEPFSPLPPDTAACTGCHDSEITFSHAFLNIAPFAEACETCHGPGAAFEVDEVHAREGN